MGDHLKMSDDELISQLYAEIDELRSDNAGLRALNTQLQASNDQLRKQLAELDEPPARMRRRLLGGGS